MPKRQGTAALPKPDGVRTPSVIAPASWSAAVPCRFSNDLKGCFDATNASKIARLKEGIRRFKWWAVVALAIVALLTLLYFRPGRDPIMVTLAGRTNIAGMPCAAVIVSNQSRTELSVYVTGVVGGQWTHLSGYQGMRPVSYPIPLQLAPGRDGTLNLRVAPGDRHVQFTFVCASYDPPSRMQQLLMHLFALVGLRYPDPKRFETTLIVSE
jgi:hypothetical protein